MSRGLVYTLHLWPPIAHAKHYTGTAKSAKRLPERLTEHALGRGARLTQVQVERGGSWVLAQTEPGGRARERSLKQRGAARRCEVCRAVDGYRAGDLSPEQALGRAGWDRASQHERGLLLDMFGISEAQAPKPSAGPAGPRAAEREPDAPVPFEGPVPFHGVPGRITPEIVALVDQLQQGWTREPHSQPVAQAPQAAAEREMEPQA
jgi:hypothetical protein